MRIFLLALALAAFAPAVHAQYNVSGGRPSSAQQVAANGGASVLPTDDPMGFHLNPALMPGVRDGLTVGGALVPQNLFSDSGRLEAVVAYGAETRAIGLPLRFGAGLSAARHAESFEVLLTSNELSRFDRSEMNVALGLGVETVGPLRLAVGATGRTFGLSAAYEDDSRTRSSGIAADLGLLATADVAALSGLAPEAASGVVPVAEVSAGYAARNLGASQSYLYPEDGTVGEAMGPLPREAVLGMGLSLGADLSTGAGRLPLVRVALNLEGNSDMVSYDYAQNQYAYSGPLGDLRIGEALIGRGHANQLDCGSNCSSYEITPGHRALTVEALGAARLTFGWQNYGSSTLFAGSRAWGIGVEPLALLNAVSALRGATSPVVRSPIDLRLGYGRLLTDSAQTYSTDVSTDAFTVTLGWVR